MISTISPLFLSIIRTHKHTLTPQTMTLKLTNPSHHPVTFQPLLLHHYSQLHRITQLLFETGFIENANFSLSASSFRLDLDSWGYDSSLTSHTLAPQKTGVGGGSGEGGGEVELKLTFLARERRLANSLLVLRNNLTGLECVLLRGRGFEGKFAIDGVRPDSGRSLVFQFSASDLEVCSGVCVCVCVCTCVFRLCCVCMCSGSVWVCLYALMCVYNTSVYFIHGCVFSRYEKTCLKSSVLSSPCRRSNAHEASQTLCNISHAQLWPCPHADPAYRTGTRWNVRLERVQCW